MNDNCHYDEFRTIRINRAETEIAQQGVRTSMIRIVYLDLRFYRMMNEGHMLAYDEQTDSFMDGGDYRPIFRNSNTDRSIRPTIEEIEGLQRDCPATFGEMQGFISDLI